MSVSFSANLIFFPESNHFLTGQKNLTHVSDNSAEKVTLALHNLHTC